MFRGRSSSGRAPPCQGGGSEFEPRRPLQKRGHNICCDLFFGFRQEIKMLGRSGSALRQGFAAQNACTAQKRRFFGSSGQRGEQGASEARKRPSGAFGARCACRGTAVLRASLVARSKKEVTTYVVTSFLDSARKLKCSGEVNSPSGKVLLRKTLVRRKSAVFLAPAGRGANRARAKRENAPVGRLSPAVRVAARQCCERASSPAPKKRSQRKL